MALVYEVTNTKNGATYIGMTTTSMSRRWYMHVWNATSVARSTKRCVLASAIRKYGADAFAYQILRDGLTAEEALLAERDLIRARNPKYNVSAGGVGPTEVKWTEERRARTKQALRNAWTDERKEAVARQGGPAGLARRERRRRIAQGLETIKPRHKRSITCLTDGMRFNTATAAGRHYGVSGGQILSACHGHGVSAAGRFFCFSQDLLNSNADALVATKEDRLRRVAAYRGSTRLRPVVCSSDDRWFPGVKAAADYYDIQVMSVVQACRHGSIVKGGALKFRYADADGPLSNKHAKTKEERAAIRARQTGGLAKAWQIQCKKVICVDDGAIFDSITDAANAYGKHVSLVSAAIHRDGKCAGKAFRFLDAPADGI